VQLYSRRVLPLGERFHQKPQPHKERGLEGHHDVEACLELRSVVGKVESLKVGQVPSKSQCLFGQRGQKRWIRVPPRTAEIDESVGIRPQALERLKSTLLRRMRIGRGDTKKVSVPKKLTLCLILSQGEELILRDLNAQWARA
jgi:hypothetical protein